MCCLKGRKETRGVAGHSALLAILFLAAPQWCLAAGILDVKIVNSYNLIVDSNVTAPSTYAPRAGYIGARVCNSGDASLANVTAYAGDYKGGVGDTPGTFPAWSSAGDPRAFIANTGTYSLTIEADQTGIADGTRYIGTLAAGQCRMQYWLFSYPRCVNVGGLPQSPPCATSITGGIKPDDDVKLDYDVWATTTTGGVASAAVTRYFTLRNEISAAANKIWPNTTSKVPNEYLAAIESVLGWGTLGPDGQPLVPGNAAYPGQRVITTEGIWYDLGNVGFGFDNDGDLVPDQNAWLQPVGDPGLFDADCFRLVKVYGIVIVKLKAGGELLVPFLDQLYFEHLPENTGVVGLVYYQFLATGQGCTAQMTPYQEAASGFDNEKFSADYGMGLSLASGSYTGGTLAFTKDDGVTAVAPGGTLTYTLNANNSGTGVHLGAPDLGVPLVFREQVPAGAVYLAGSAVAGLTTPTGTGTSAEGFTGRDGVLDNCTINYSVSAASYVTRYSADNGLTWSFTEPAPASTTSNLEWILMTTLALDGGHNGTDCVAPDGAYDDGTLVTSLPAGKSASLTFGVAVNVAAPYPGAVLCNTAGIGYGSAVASVTAEDCDVVTGGNTLNGIVFQDDGTGAGVSGNGAKDGTEAGIGAGVRVELYFDKNGDGKHDSGDLLVGATATAADGTYSFVSLADGSYVVLVQKYNFAGASNDVNDFNAGWGYTTLDPNLALTTDQGILKRDETLNAATLAVNVDYLRDSGNQSVTGVNFAFAPPLSLKKAVKGNPDADANGVADTAINEGALFSYTISLTNRLPNTGRQGATGCEYTAWATTGNTGSGGKAFTNPGNVYDAEAPNQTVGNAFITGGANQWVWGTTLNLPRKEGNVTRVEALFFGYFGVPLTDDFLNVAIGSGTVSSGVNGLTGDIATGSLSTQMIDSYIGEPASLDPYNAISWDISTLKPLGTGTVADWNWSPTTNFFPTVYIQANPAKTAASDYKYFYLDAFGLRVTTDKACQASNSTTLGSVPLQDSYDTGSFDYVSADPAPTSVNTATGVIRWDNVGPISPGTTRVVTVNLRARNMSVTRTGSCGATPPPAANSACNWAETAYGSKNVTYADGRLANDAIGKIAVNIAAKAELHGVVWKDSNNDGWPNNDGEPLLPNVILSLYACVRSDGVTLETSTSNVKDCASMTAGNSWKKLATTVTDASGAYEFIGLDQGYYLVEVGDTDGVPGTGSTSPFGGTQTAEPNDVQTYAGGGNDATGTAGVCAGGCNNTWGTSTANLRSDQTTINLLADGTAGSQERINGINFGYTIANAVIYGNLWHDIDGDAAADPGDSGLSGFTVRLYSDPNGDGNPADGTLLATTSSDVNGNYSFTGLGAASFVIVVTPPTLRDKSWTETIESTGGTGSLDNQIPVTVTAGTLSGSHNFGYTMKDTSSIGDTLYYDFNANGAQDATEAGIPSVTVWLYRDADRDGRIDASTDTIVQTTVTGVSGKYLFSGVPAGSYIVKVDTADLDFATDVTATGDPDINHASIGDLVWFDLDGDGVRDAGEDGISNVVVNLYIDADGNGTKGPGDQLVCSTVTDINGAYLFTGLSTGGYFVDIDETSLPSTLLAITTTDPVTTLITLTGRTSATSVLTADAGYSLGSNYAIGNRIWNDIDNDNTQDPREPGIPGIRVTVTNGTGTGCSPSCTAITDAGGFWIVTGATGLTSGTFTVAVAGADLPRGFTLTAGTDPRTATVAGVDLMNVDFGYRYTGAGTSPTGTLSGRVFKDLNGDGSYQAGEALSGTRVNLLDAAGAVAATTSTAADGAYSFSGVFIGTYTVRADDTLGSIGSSVFLSAASTITGVDLVFSNTSETVANGESFLSVDGVHANLLQDFGYQRFQGSIGDTVYHDVNENATQDLGEPGLPGVTVKLYLWKDGVADGGNGDGVIAPGELTLQTTTTTTSDDPLSASDEGGKYLFSNLVVPVTGRYLVQVDTATLPGTTQTLIADPDTDGVPCTLLPDPDVSGDEYPPPAVCDSRDALPSFTSGMNYLGADFGYRISGAGYATIGDTLWVDTNGDGVKDPGEDGVGTIVVWMDTSGDGVLNWIDGNANGKWESGEGERWVVTDSDGFYVFTNVVDGTYDVKVLASRPVASTTTAGSTTVTSAGLFMQSDLGAVISGAGIPPGATVTGFTSSSSITISANATATGSNPLTLGNWPAFLPTTPTYEAWLANTASLNNAVQVVVAGGVVTTLIDGDPATPDGCAKALPATCNHDADFGYRYAGSNTLAGTICTESGTLNGYCGATATTYSGVGAGESPLAGVLVGLYLWNDADADGIAWNGSGVLDPGDSFIFLASAPTGDDGDYAFTNVPTGKLVLVMSVQETQNLDLTTTSVNTSVEGSTPVALHEGTGVYQGNTVTLVVRQAINLAGNTLDADFAFDPSLGGLIAYDYGDLPDSGTPDYDGTLLASGGARNLVTGSSIHLGAGVTTEADGYDSPTATGDVDNGVSLVSTSWNSGADGAGVNVTASAAGWLVGWLDFNQDGDFNDAHEEIINQAVPAGASTITFFVADSASGTDYNYFSRFRIYPSRPTVTSSVGTALDAFFQPATGEVEDYQFNIHVTLAVVTEFSAHDSGGNVQLEWQTSAEVGTIGWYLRRRSAPSGDGWEVVNESMIPALVQQRQGGSYRHIDSGAVPGKWYDYELVEVEAGGRRITHGPYRVDTGARYDSADGSLATAAPGAFVLPPMAGSFSQTALTPDVAPVRTGALPQAAPDTVPEAFRSAKVAVAAEGLVYVDLSSLASTLGQSYETVRTLFIEGRFGVTNKGRAVAFRPDADYRGIYFYALGIDSPYTGANIYHVMRDAKVRRMPTRDGRSATTLRTDESFAWTEHIEQDSFAVLNAFKDPEADFWFWDYIIAGHKGATFKVRTDGIDSRSPATLTVQLKGASDSADDNDHHTTVKINGTQVGKVIWDGLGSLEASFLVPAGLLADGESAVEIEGALDNGAPYSIVYVDSFDLAYSRQFRAHQNRLEFTKEAEDVLLTGFTSPDVRVLDVTNPLAPVLVATTPLSFVDGTFGLALADPRPGRRYHATTTDAALSPSRLSPDRPSALFRPENAAKYLIVTTRDLSASAQKLADYRRAGGMSALVVDIEDVYDEFNFGIPSPHALKKFLLSARNRWLEPPKYVLLAGDASYDYKDRLGYGENIVPTLMESTAHGLFPSDTRLADVAGNDGVPEFSVGRLPATTAEALDAMIDKVMVRERAAGAQWLNRLLFLADDPDEAGDFVSSSDSLATLAPPSGVPSRVYLSDLSVDEARERLFAGLNSGVGLTTFFGHAGFDTLAAEGLLTSGDVVALTNGQRPTVLAALTCLAGNFATPGYSAIGERLLSAPGVGAAAVWAPTGLSHNDLAATLANQFMSAYRRSRKVRVGDAILSAMRSYRSSVNDAAMLNIYVLLGDPAMVLR